MISNSVMHLRSYTNTAIADIGRNSMPILPETPHERLYRHAKRDVATLSADVIRIESHYHRIKWQVFHNVLRVFHKFMMFY